MKKLQILSKEELKNIEGGDWIRNLGKGSHKAWCSFKNGVSQGFQNMMSVSDTNNVG